jgi:hypothetical protein
MTDMTELWIQEILSKMYSRKFRPPPEASAPGALTLYWPCEICKTIRPDNFISVETLDISKQYNLKEGTIWQNVKYCNDNQECKTKAQMYRSALSSDPPTN